MVLKLKMVFLIKFKLWQIINMENVFVAKLGKAVGLKGEIKIHIESDFPKQFKKGANFSTNKKNDLLVEVFNEKRGTIKFQGIDDVDMAKKLTNLELYSSFDKTRENCTLSQGEYFWFDIISCDVIENDIILGKIKDIHRYPICDYLEIITDKILIDKELPKNFLLPYVNEEYILNVDIKNKKVYVKDALAILENS